MVYAKLIFFNGFTEFSKEDPGDLSLVESESPVICSAEQVVGQFSLYYSQRASHALKYARPLPMCSDTIFA